MTMTTDGELPKNFQPVEAEERWRAFWEQQGFFGADNSSDRDTFTIVIPPPNVTGVLHLGHGLVQTIQDVLIRYHRMAGDETLWVPGTDHAGIATQHVVVEKLRAEGRTRQEMGREAFVSEVWKWKDEYHARITNQIKRLGCSCDWSREAFTLDDDRAKAVRRAFKTLYDEGLIYRGKYMINWDPVSLTALADDEVEYEDEEGQLWHIRYPFSDGSGRYAVVATTRPETLLGDTAVAVNPGDGRYTALVGQTVDLPLTGRKIPIIADDFVKKEFGSGMVKITPAHDPNDFACGQRHNMELINIFTDTAVVNDNAPEAYRGLDRYVAREKVVEDLKALGLIEKIEKHPHRVGRGYRSKAIVEPRISDQWFVKVAPLAKLAADAVHNGETRIIPKAQENTYFAWMDNLRDWCISRQLWWGHRIPIWYRRDNRAEMVCWDGEGLPPEVAADPDAWEQDPDVLDTWFSSALWPFSVLGWPEDTDDMSKFFPTSVLVTGHDILFFWVARMIMMSKGLLKKVPFHTVYLHGLIFGKSFYRRRGGDMELISPTERRELCLDDMDSPPKGIEFKWEKMSKSKGNVIDPLDMFDQFGVDSVRSALIAYSGQGRTIEIDKHRIAGYRNFINKLWNASRFVLTATADITPEEFRGGVSADSLQREDRWILSRLSDAITTATRHLDEYTFDQYIQSLYHFLWDDYCDWYVELTKPRVYGKEGTTPESTRAAKVVLLTVLEHVLRMLHPVIPHATEEIWQLLRARLAGVETGVPVEPATLRPGALPFVDNFEAPSLCVAPWPKGRVYTDAAACDGIDLLQEALYMVRNIRGEMTVPVEMKVDVEFSHPDGAIRALLEEAAMQIRALASVKEMTVVAAPGVLPFASKAVKGDLVVQVPLPGELREAEVSRLEKELGKLEKGVQGTRGKLANEKFVANAPEAVVVQEREKLAKYEADMEAIKARLVELRG
ncbi:MAG: valine--tRNA ligase [Candidatus Sumerlaeia bacterium]|nr:valine--tRNA ligase [Candidatus Sumerlaeia bacterium]